MIGATPYVRMSVKELIALGPEIKRVAMQSSHLYLWTVNKTFPDAVRILEAWGYRWVTVVTWDKQRPGIAKYFQGTTEHCIFGVRGNPPYKFVDGKMQQGRTLITERMTDHSRKPVAMREAIEKVSRGPFLELFGRRVPKGWDAIGFELE
jgi:N6-adenosine-specific RNA methylase IME4